MRADRIMPERWNKLLREALKFGIVGGVNTVINFVVFNALALTIFHNGQLKANVVATVFATITSYFMNRHWTYRDRPKSAIRRETTLFVLFNATGLVIELGVLGIAKYGLDMHSLLWLNVFKFLGLGLATIFRFYTYRTFVFRAAPAPEVALPSVATVRQNDHHLDGDVIATFDPVAELAEVVEEFESAGSARRHR
ncbi:Putative flippase GtrA (transmembrane translocase of bactoprenol-linked glucose) [Asanoa hainanensis]|uniref:Putative flippase GtrA (Transmembrane translocase of bactoprenol-linked glucose) n=1 Tax=Asanoa hainanensis TaxID=560556 RepID=A0A239KM05_9ACTN|nr:Putative flippase GtrA (transmembrane translocase of bactoprenol-linked glucose) [Asanoa hainanensis]